MKLPYVENAVIPEAKITRYLLNDEHSRGKDKAIFFMRFGFSLEQWQVLRDALLEHLQLHEVSSTLDTPEGVHYVIDGTLNTPDEREPNVRTVWAIDTDSEIPRFITAYPLK